MFNWNRVFWVVFVVLGAFIIAGTMVRIIYLDIVMGLLVVGVGAARLAEEITHRKMQHRHRSMHESINYLTSRLDSASGLAERLKENSESRFFKVDNKLRVLSGNMDDKYDAAVKKVIGLENRINDHSKFMLELAKRQESIKLGKEISQEPLPDLRPIIKVPSVVHENKIVRFELPRIAPRKSIKKVRSRSKRGLGNKTIINIQAPRTRVIKKIVKVESKKPKKSKALKTPKKKKEATKNISINIG
jgi:hypothetical protein